MAATVIAMCAAGVAVFVIAILTARSELVDAHGLDRIVALTTVCVAVPLGVFGALHIFGPRIVLPIVPPYMPWRMFWVYVVGCGLLGAAVSIALRISVRWSGLLFGIMMFLFVAMIHLPGALRQHDRIIWTIVFREMSFGAAGWILAGIALGPGVARSTLVTVGRVLATITVIVFGIEHFLHPTGLPGVPLAKQIPAWIPAPAVIDYLTGAALLVVGFCSVVNRHLRIAAAAAGAWLVLMLLVIYLPVMMAALGDPRIGTQLEGVNYFADTMLFTGVVLTLARASATTG